MTAHVLGQADGSTGPGLAATHPVVGLGGRTVQIGVYDYNMGTDNYTSNGNDISSIWNEFAQILYIGIEQVDTNTAADRRDFAIDYTAKTLLCYTAFNTESTAADQGVVTVRLCVVGYR